MPFSLFFFLFDKGSERYPESPLIGVAGPLCVIEFKSHARGRVRTYVRACVRVWSRACRTIIEAWSANYVSPTYVPLGNPPPSSSFCSFLSRTPVGIFRPPYGHVCSNRVSRPSRLPACACPVESGRFFFLATEDTRHRFFREYGGLQRKVSHPLFVSISFSLSLSPFDDRLRQ